MSISALLGGDSLLCCGWVESDESSAEPPRAAVLLIGDELLSGKIRDANGHFLAQVLRRRGMALVEIRTVGDAPEDIGRALLDLAARASFVFTSGGVGPTHDDRTLEAIAAATGRPLVRNAEMAAELAQHYGDRATKEAMSMADLPEGTTLRAGPGWPVLRLDLDEPGPCRVYILPGVPPLLRAKIERLEATEGELPHAGGLAPRRGPHLPRRAPPRAGARRGAGGILRDPGRELSPLDPRGGRADPAARTRDPRGSNRDCIAGGYGS